MKENPHLTQHSQKCHFQKAMGNEACRTYVDKIFSEEEDYAAAVDIIRTHYENPRMLHMHHHKTFHVDSVVEYNRKDIQEGVDRYQKYIKAMATYKVTTLEQSAVMHQVTHMSPQLLTQWKKYTKKHKTTPMGKDYVAFMEDQVECMGAEEIEVEEVKPTYKPFKSKHNKKQSHGTVLQTKTGGPQCTLCKGTHYLASCSKYQEKTVAARQEHARTAHLCFNCLGTSHRQSECRSEHKCKTCGKKHHTTLHTERHSAPTKEPEEPEATSMVVKPYGSSVPPRVGATAIVVVAAEGLCQRACAQFDSGSTVSLITKKLAQTLKAPKIPNSGVKLWGATGSGSSPYKVQITLIGKQGEEIIVEPHVQDSIACSSTRLNLKELRKLPFLKGLPLADPECQSMSRIDLLLDVETSNACFSDEVRSGPTPGMKVQHTIFGWAISGGETTQVTAGQREAVCSRLQVEEEDPIQIFRDLIALEDDHNSPLTADEELALKHFEEHVTRDSEGRYYVSLPRRVPMPKLGKSRAAAVRRYLCNERSLKTKGQWQTFSKAVDDYFELGHSEVVPSEELHKPAEETYYLPMHGVTKEASTSTKLRVVFDASATTSTGVSLNDTLLPGPSLHPLLTAVLTSF